MPKRLKGWASYLVRVQIDGQFSDEEIARARAVCTACSLELDPGEPCLQAIVNRAGQVLDSMVDDDAPVVEGVDDLSVTFMDAELDDDEEPDKES